MTTLNDPAVPGCCCDGADLSADLTARLAALLCGASEHGELIVAPESDDPRNRIAACYQCQRHAAVLAEAGVGFVAEAETRRLDMERERNHAEVRAERAEAALEKVRALADAWERDAAAACDGADHSGCPDCGGKVYAADLRAYLGGTP